MSILKTTIALVFALALSACGGGGGSSGSSSGTTGTTTTGTTTTGSTTTPTAAAASLALVFTDSAGTTLSSNAITSGSIFYAKATLTDAAGVAVANALINFSTDATVGSLSQTVALTDGSGVAKVQIAPATISTAAAAALTAQTTYEATAINASANYQTSAASVTLGAVTPTPNSIQALQSSAVTTSVSVSGAPATAGQVAVTFSASCGTFSPAVVATSSAGTASSTYQSLSTCSGNVSLTASASGATNAGTGTISVAAATAANILFVSATPASIVSSSATGTKQSAIIFKVVDSSGAAKASESVVVTLDAQSSGAGVTFSAGGTSQTVSTDGAGLAQVTIQSGALPTPVVVKAELASNAAMFANSSGIVVTAGKASQSKSSLSVDNLSIEGLNVDGATATITWRVSDRQSNAVPAGAAVTFVANSGTISSATGGASCLLDAASTCSVTYTTSGARPSAASGGVDGRVVILAYMDGEESFVDVDGDNLWDSTETFTDMGIAYRDDNLNGVRESTEQTYPGGATGTASCLTNGGSNLDSVSNSCDGTWSSSIRVRQQATISLADSTASITLVGAATTTGFTVTIGDGTNPTVSMPTGSLVSAAVTTGSATCSVSSVSPNVVRNQALAGNHTVNLTGTNCSGARVEVTVTTPSQFPTVASFAIP